jgi:Xaa-Pro aminopeptidase
MLLSKLNLTENFSKLSTYLQSNDVEALYLSGSDYFLSEYTAKEDSLRNYLTPFTGSTAEVLIVPSKKLYLFVDGRYHYQAELECKEMDYIEVVKVPTQFSLLQELINTANELTVTTLAVIAERTQLSKLDKFHLKNIKTKPIETQKIEQLMGVSFKFADSEVYLVDEKVLPSNFENKFSALNLPIKQAIYLSSCDDIAWLSHCRSYQIPGNSYFLSKALVTSDHLYIFVPSEAKISAGAQALSEVTFYKIEMAELEVNVHKVLDDNNITQVCFDPNSITVSDFELLKNKFDSEDLIKKTHPVTQLRIYKSQDEIKEFERIFLLSSKAIAETIRFAKKQVKQNLPFSEKDLSEKIWTEYKKLGARALSFNTIAGVGDKSAIIHYGACSPSIFLQKGTMTLLDSGAYYESGMATDCTRSFIPEFQSLSSEKQQYYKKIYTIVLKAQLQAEMSVFKAGTLGNAIDQVSRGVMLKYGMDFGHGLGHGVGVLVHDPGAGRLSPQSREELHAGVVCSIEPGYYLDGQYGIRLENVEYVAQHHSFQGLLKFKPLVFVSWEEELIDRDLLAPDELEYLNWYQAECKKLGNHTSID